MNTRTSKLWRIGAVAVLALLGVLVVTAGMGALAAASPPPSLVYVRTDGDDGQCDGTVDVAYSAGVAPSCAAQTIQGGIDKVNVGGTVVVATGTYAENVIVSKDVTLLGAGAGSTVVDAGGASRGIYVNTLYTMTVSGVTVQNGRNVEGAGIYVNTASVLTLTDSTVYDNYSGSNDGAGLSMKADATVVISGCSFISNTTGSGSRDGGGVSNVSGDLVVVGSTFDDNSAGDRGGAIFSGGSGSSLSVTGSTFAGNDAFSFGGGIAVSVTPAESLFVATSVFTGNRVSGAAFAYGGGMHVYSGKATISNTTVTSNTSSYGGGGLSLNSSTVHVYGAVVASNVCTGASQTIGGGVYNYESKLAIEESVLRDNWVSGGSALGGGLYNDGSSTLDRVTVSGNASRDNNSGGIHSVNPLTMTNVTVSGNAAGYLAGGLMQTGSGMTATLVNCTIVSNTITSGGAAGGLFVYATVNVTNTLLAYNDNDNCAAQSGGVINSYGHNLEDDDTCYLTATGDITDTDPLLDPLADNGGPSVGATAALETMRTHALGAGSEAINAGDDAACPATDQRGRPRVGVCDIGAYEAPGRVYLPLVLRSY